MAVLPRRFYARDAAMVARELLGKVLTRRVGGRVRRARITETEAYVGSHDLASHSRHGPTARNRTMFGPPGHAYVYFVYGMHHCLNAVTGADGVGEAVLLRAAEPLDGWAARLSGPGLLAKAFGVTRADDGADLVSGPVRILDGPAPADIEATSRIGVDYAGDWAHRPLRFLAAGKPLPKRLQVAATGKSLQGSAQARDMLERLHCEPCTRATPSVEPDEARRLHRQIPQWRLEPDRLVREWRLKDFREALALLNAIGDVAEGERHHPDLHLTDYKRLRVELSTHAIHALSRNDFVLAAKIDALPEARGTAEGRPRGVAWA